MPGSEEFNDKLTQVKRDIEAVGDEIRAEEPLEDNDGNRVGEMLVCQHGGNTFLIQAPYNKAFFKVKFGYTLLGDVLAERLDDQQDLDPSVDEIPQSIINEAQNQLKRQLSNIGPSNTTKLTFKLVQLISNPDTAYELFRTDKGQVMGFEVNQKIFPFRDKYDISELNSAIQAVITTGVPGRIFLQMVFNLRPEIPESTETGSTIHDDRSFY